MDRHFHSIQHFGSDVYVADYTQYVQEHGCVERRGVVISESKPEEIGSLKFNNPNGIDILAVNFEKNESTFRLADGHKVANCECMLVAETGRPKRWLALAELKYCKGEERNIADNFMHALQQLRDTFLFLRDNLQLFGAGDYRYYWVVSMPEHSDKVPFSAFVLSQDDLVSYKETYNSIIISDNVVDVWTGSIIKNPIYE